MKKTTKKLKGFSDEEKEAMKERALELKANKKDGEDSVRLKINEMKGLDRIIAERLHSIIKKAAPELSPRTWYGMPAYANKTGKVVCFFQNAQKFKTRYATLGFSDSAKLDDGDMWPTSYALKNLTEAEETKIIALINKATNGK